MGCPPPVGSDIRTESEAASQQSNCRAPSTTLASKVVPSHTPELITMLPTHSITVPDFFARSGSVLRERIDMKNRMIQRCRDAFPIRMMCRYLRVPPSGYYGWGTRTPSARAQENARLRGRIRALHADHDGIVWSPRIWEDLRYYVCPGAVWTPSGGALDTPGRCRACRRGGSGKRSTQGHVPEAPIII